MLKFVCLLFFICLGDRNSELCNAVSSEDQGLPIIDDTSTENFGIVGGHNIDITEAPYQVALFRDNEFYCGGSIIAKDLIITAAHCFDPLTSSFMIRAGTSSYTGGAKFNLVIRYKIHENYIKKTLVNDIALAWMAEPLEFNNKIQAIALDDAGFNVENGALLTVTGWGATRFHGHNPATLQSVQVPKVDLSTCQKDFIGSNYIVTSSHICGGYAEGGRNSCQGDSGGPVVYNGKLSGIVSWSSGCAQPNKPGVFTSVAAYRQWIFQNSQH